MMGQDGPRVQCHALAPGICMESVALASRKTKSPQRLWLRQRPPRGGIVDGPGRARAPY